jgi:hypothetical protein
MKNQKVKKAAQLFEDFTGHKPGHVDELRLKTHDVALKIGQVDGILYTTIRDGKTERYIHRFKKKSRPLLAASYDGQQLYILGGEYAFTDRGIVDK